MASTAADLREDSALNDSPPFSTPTEQPRRTSDPFAMQRETSNDDPFASNQPRRGSEGSDMEPVPLAKRDRRMSKEWDAAQTPPSRFQKVEGSIYATPASRDGHVARNKIHGFKEKVKELSGSKK